MADEILLRLCNPAKIERDSGALDFQRFLNDVEVELVPNVQKDIVKLISDNSLAWESKHGGLIAAKILLSNSVCSLEWAGDVSHDVMNRLEDDEFRVRLAAGEVMEVLCRRVGPEIYERFKDRILSGVQTNLERDCTNESENPDAETLLETLSSSPSSPERRVSTDAAQIFHETAGWKSLETWMKCLQCVIKGCGHHFNAYITQELMDLVFQALMHTNRFVRETGYYVCSALVGCGVNEEGAEAVTVLDEENAVYRHGHQFSDYLARGMADNWSQVRLASSVATRRFLQSLPSDSARDNFYSIMLPKMCLNRYYVAEGVRIYSQETWRRMTAGQGRQLVEKYIKEVVAFYIDQSAADNHAVREAACACIAELGSKIGHDVVSPYVSQLMDALFVCFNDESWPVRDAACVASGNFVLCFPDESRNSMDSLYPLFFNNLQDNIASVRQGAAVALCNVARAYGEESIQLIIPKIKEGFENLDNQPENVEKFSGVDTSPATYGVIKMLHDNDIDVHTDRQMYSCGSLAPKMGPGKREGGCMDNKFRKPSEPWELADGCIHLVAELSTDQKLAPNVSDLLPLMSTAAAFRHYTHHFVFLETLCKQIPDIARGIGKRTFKPHIESFLDAIFYSLTSDNALTSSAASQCLNQLGSFLGPNILRGRVEQYNIRYLGQLDANQCLAPL